MFTGIVEEIGRVVRLIHASDVLLWNGDRGEGWILTISCKVVLQGAYVGCSIAVNGTCLTVTSFTDGEFTVGCAPETMRKTNIISLIEGSPVNLERSMAADGRNSGHFVQGHVDGTGRIAAFWREGDSLWVRVATPTAILRYIVPKGYIAVDGTSLTVCDVVKAGCAAAVEAGCKPDEGFFTFMLIAYTQQHIILPRKSIDELVNLEADVMGKYAERAASGLEASLERMELALQAAVARIEGRLDAIEGRVAALEGRQ